MHESEVLPWKHEGRLIQQQTRWTKSLMMPNLTVRSRAEAPQAGIKQGLMSLQLSCRPSGQWFSPWQGFYCAANHCISPLLSTHPGAMSADQWRWDWRYIWIGDGHLQPPLCSDKWPLSQSPSSSIPPVRQIHFSAQISDQVPLVPKHSLRITCHMRWWWPGRAPVLAGSSGESSWK